MPFGGLLTVGIISAAGALGGAAISSKASKTAAQQQVDSAQQALDFQKLIWGQQQENQAPFLQAGQQSIAKLMEDIAAGKFGAGSLPAVPTAPGAFTGTFKAPSLEEARATPGYEFTREQGSRGILQGAAAAGGAISGGTLKALDTFNTGLADTTYNDVFNRALQTYQAGLQGYQANLQGYGSQLAGYEAAQGAQQQEFQQALAPAQIGEGAIVNLNNTASGVAQSVGNLMTGIGNAQAAGTVGSANAWNSALGSIGNTALQTMLLKSIMSPSNASGTAPVATSVSDLMSMGLATPISQGLGPG